MIISVLAVALGGFLGGLARWALGRAIPAHGGRVSTFAANIVASAVLGLSTALPDLAQVMVAVGFAAGMSTMSTFARELGDLLRRQRWRDFTTYLLATTVLGLIAAWRGAIWGQRILANLGT